MSDNPGVQQTIVVKASAEKAFRVFTAEIDSWWPRSHHIGSSPMQEAIIEPRTGGRCFSTQLDGTECDWGTVLVWEPPHRLVLAWQVAATWKYEPDLEKSSEVEIRFTPNAGGETRVDLEHRHLERHGADFAAMRARLASPGGWSGLLERYAARVTAAA